MEKVISNSEYLDYLISMDITCIRKILIQVNVSITKKNDKLIHYKNVLIRKALIHFRNLYKPKEDLTTQIQHTSNCVQKHGFDFENEIRRVFNLPPVKNNTDTWDIPKESNIFDNNENISVKTTKSASICCSDIIRFHDINFDEKNTIIVGRYKQKGVIKDFYNFMEINYCEKLHNVLFGSCPVDVLNDYVKYIKSCNSKDSPEYLKKKKEIQQKYNMGIIINPKVDSKKQKRVQCSIPTKLLDLHSEYVRIVDNIRGYDIKTKYKSPARKFK